MKSRDHKLIRRTPIKLLYSFNNKANNTLGNKLYVCSVRVVLRQEFQVLSG